MTSYSIFKSFEYVTKITEKKEELRVILLPIPIQVTLNTAQSYRNVVEA